MKNKPRLLRITTVPISLKLLLRGQLEFMQEQGFEVLAVSASGPETAYITSRGIQHKVIEMTRKITPVQDIVSLIKLVALILEFRPDIVHTHTPKAGLLGMMAAWICRVPTRFHTVAGLPLMEATGLKRKLLLFTEQITYACSTAVYPNSQGLLDFIKSNVPAGRKKSAVIGKGSSNGIDSTFFSASESVKKEAAVVRSQHSIRADETVFCFVGRIVRDKGIDELVEAFERIDGNIPARLLLVGPFEDDLDPVSAKTRNSIENNERIITLGYQNDVRPAMAASDVFVFPSYREGFPNVVMQACCLQLPSIVSNINGCNEIIKDQVTGLIIPVKNADSVYQAMKFMTDNSESRRDFAARARKFVVENFDQQYLWNLLLAEYKKHV